VSQFTLAARQRRRLGGGKGALYRETLQATGCYVGRVVIATAEFAPMPLFHLPGYPGGHYSDGHRMRFWRYGGIYQSDVGSYKPQNPNRTPPPAGIRVRVRERAGRSMLSPIVLMSSGRLFLDRVGRHQSPSPLHRRDQNKLIARSEGTNYHRTVPSVLTGCLSFRDKRNSLLFSAKENCSEPIRLGALRVATFYGLPGIPGSTLVPIGRFIR
jgi:hypothetical protein